eukprot:7990230-Pyramimonas_sp.AAC.1
MRKSWGHKSDAARSEQNARRQSWGAASAPLCGQRASWASSAGGSVRRSWSSHASFGDVSDSSPDADLDAPLVEAPSGEEHADDGLIDYGGGLLGFPTPEPADADLDRDGDVSA